jgi:hypothetical protein
MVERPVAEVENWFVRNGLPSFVRRPRRRPATTVSVLLAVLAAFEVAVVAPDPDWPWWLDVAVAVVGMFAAVVGLSLAGRLKARVGGRGAGRWVSEVGFVLVPVAVVAVADGNLLHVAEIFVVNVAVLAGLVVDDRTGVVAVTRWATRYAWSELAPAVRRLARSVPLIAVVVLALFYTGEVWQVAATIDGANLAVVCALLAAAGVGFAVVQARAGLGEERAADPVLLVADTPAAQWPIGPDVPLARDERANVAVLLYVAQASTVAIAAGLFGMLVIAFGAFAIPVEVLTSWIGSDPTIWVRFDGVVSFAVTRELAVTGALVAGFTSLVFAVSLTGDDEFQLVIRRSLATRLAVALAVRSAYLHALGNTVEPSVGKPGAL